MWIYNATKVQDVDLSKRTHQTMTTAENTRFHQQTEVFDHQTCRLHQHVNEVSKKMFNIFQYVYIYVYTQSILKRPNFQ